MRLLEDSIHVCFSIRDRDGKYSKYAGAAIASLLRKTRERVTVHLFHDDTIAGERLGRFQRLVHDYGQKIVCYRIDAEKEFGHLRYMSILKNVSLGTMFRLKIPELLPSNVEKLLYLDADTLTNLDVQELWNIPFDGALMIGRQDKTNEFFQTYRLFTEGHMSFRGYVNAGVLLLDLAGIRREHRLLEESMQYFEAYPDTGFADMDALNYVLRGRTKTIDEKYNTFTVDYRGKQEPLRSAIYHFAGDYVHAASQESFERLFWEVVEMTPWKNEVPAYFIAEVQHLENAYRWMRHCFFRMNGRKIVFWGAGSVMRKTLMVHMKMSLEQSYFVDNNPELWGETLDGIDVCSPDALKKEAKGTFFVIVMSKRHYADIRNELMCMGLEEDEDFINADCLALRDENPPY